MNNGQNAVIGTFLAVFLVVSAFVYLKEEPIKTKKDADLKVSKLTAEIIEKRKIDLNTADAEDLTFIPGIGPALADNICEYRKNNGYFTEFGDLLKVKGIGPKKLETITIYSKIK